MRNVQINGVGIGDVISKKTFDLKLEPKTALERHVAKWIRAHAWDGSYNMSAVVRDLMNGCSSGIVGHLIYYVDTTKFFRRYRKEIGELIADFVDSTGEPFRPNGWDDRDPLALDTTNQNILAWFGFEEAARIVAMRAGWDG